MYQIQILTRFLIILFFSACLAFGQDPGSTSTVRANSTVPLKYERNSVSFLLVNFPGDSNLTSLISVWPKMTVPDKYNNHNLPLMVIQAPYTDRYDRKANGLETALYLNKTNIGREVVRKWFNQQKDGTFNMDLVKERGLYNATDADVKTADAEQRGRAVLEDAGESLIDRTFIVVLDFKHIEKIADYYYRRKELAAQGIMMLGQISGNAGVTELGREAEVIAKINLRPGYRATVDSYVFKLHWDEAKSATFYEQVWNNPKNLDTMDIPVKLVAHKQTFAENPGLEDKPVDIFMTELANRGAEFAMNVSTNSIDELRVRSLIKSVRPIKAKIGLKEGVKPDQRYVMVEISKDNFGQPTEKIVGVARATRKISDNREMSTGQTVPTKFRQESGKRPYQGMTLVQKNDVGIGLSFGYAPLTQGYVARLELKLARIFRIPQLKLYADFQLNGIQAVTYQTGTAEITQNTAADYMSIGLSKEYFLMRNIHIEPFIGCHVMRVPQFSSGYKIGLNAGLRIPINIFRWLQLVPSVSYSTIQYSKTSDLIQTKTLIPVDVALRVKF